MCGLLQRAGRNAAVCRGVRSTPAHSIGSKGFASQYGADFYALPRSSDKVTLERETWTVPAEYRFGEQGVVPLRAGETVFWRVQGSDTTPC